MDDNWLTDWLTHSLIDDKIMITKSVIIPAVSGLYRPTGLLFLHVLRYQFENWYIHAVGGVIRQVRVSFQSGHFDLLYSHKYVKVIYLHSWPYKSYRGLRFGTHAYIVGVLILTDFRHGLAIFGPLMDKNTWKGVLLELPASEKFSRLFCTCCEISAWNLAYTSCGWCHTSSLSFIPIWTLWPTLQQKIGQSHLFAFMAFKII